MFKPEIIRSKNLNTEECIQRTYKINNKDTLPLVYNPS